MNIEKPIRVTGTVVINKKADDVFSFVSDPANDKFWRTEINESSLDGALQAGVKVREYSYLSKKANNHLLVLQCTRFEKNQLVVFETPDNSPFYQKSEREVRVVSDHTTEVIYTLDFDMNIVKHALGFALPKFVVSFKAKSDMKKYLKQLKEKIEHK